MNVGAVIATSVFVLGALYFFVPDMWERFRSRRGFALVIGPRLDYIAVVASVVGIWIISLALGLTLFQAVLVWLGLIIFNIKGNYR